MCFQIFLSLAVFAVSIEGAAAYSTGLVTPSCTSLIPTHSSYTTQTSPSPYNISASKYTYSPGDRITVTLDAPSNFTFQGFLLQAQVVGESVPMGSFVSFNTTLSQGLTCNNSTNSTVSHRSSVQKTQMIATWEAPRDNSPGDFVFRATFVRKYDEFWALQNSQLIRMTNSSCRLVFSPCKYILLAVIGLLLNYY